MAMYPTVDETACKLKAASFSLSVKVMHDGRYLAETIDMNGVRGPTGEGLTPDRAAFMALVLLEHYPDAYAARARQPAGEIQWGLRAGSAARPAELYRRVRVEGRAGRLRGRVGGR